MTSQTSRIAALLSTALVVAGLAPVARASDDLAPLIEHEKTQWAKAGQPLRLRAKVTSMSGAEVKAEVRVRPVGLKTFSSVPLEPVQGLAQVLQAEIPAALVEGQFDYYIEAYDMDGNGPGLVGSPDEPVHVRTYTGSVPPEETVAESEQASESEPAQVPAEALAAPTQPQPPSPGLLERTPGWAWGVLGGAVLAAGGALALKMSSNAIADRNETTIVDGVAHHSVTQAEAQWANTAASASGLLGGVALGLAGAGAAAILVEF